MSTGLRIVPLGGMGKVTLNIYLYEYEDEILIVDCGIGFPDQYMPGVDILIPDIKYLQDQLQKGKHIAGMLLTHGHDDHIAATPYILPELPEDFEIYGSPLTAGFAENRMNEMENPRKVTVVQDKKWVKIGKNFEIMALAMTHSVPDTKHYLIKTPAGVVYHGTDFKLDENPVDGVLPDYEGIKQAGENGVDLLLSDCLRVENATKTKSESTVGPVLEKQMTGVKGKVIVTLMSSHLHRIQQTINAAQKLKRKVAFVGRSVEQNMDVALRLGKVNMPQGMLIDKQDIANYPDEELCIIIAGSQGQEGSSMIRAIYGEHRIVNISKQDKVIFSADAIPGNQIPYYAAINELFRNEVDVIYPTLEPDIHQSGHGGAPEQQKILKLVNPKHAMPIGGEDRHRVLYKKLVAKAIGYNPKNVLIPDDGEVLLMDHGQIEVVEKVHVKARTVDGLGIGDVGPKVIADRKALGNAGMIVLVIMRDAKTKQFDLKNIKVVSRGFVFMQEADDVINFLQAETAKFLKDGKVKKMKDGEIRGRLERRLGRKLYKIIRREPMVVASIIDL
jgi:ribonuclease J